MNTIDERKPGFTVLLQTQPTPGVPTLSSDKTHELVSFEHLHQRTPYLFRRVLSGAFALLVVDLFKRAPRLKNRLPERGDLVDFFIVALPERCDSSLEAFLEDLVGAVGRCTVSFSFV
jgi:hypothetical protein